MMILLLYYKFSLGGTTYSLPNDEGHRYIELLV